MTRWLKRIGGAVLMGIAWGVAWAPIGLIIALIVDRDGRMDEPWIAVGTYPGFLSGFFLCLVLWLAERRPYESWTGPRIAGWGALVGALVVLVPVGLSAPGNDPPFPLVAAAAVVGSALFAAVSAAITLRLARKADQNFFDGGSEGDDLQAVAPQRHS